MGNSMFMYYACSFIKLVEIAIEKFSTIISFNVFNITIIK